MRVFADDPLDTHKYPLERRDGAFWRACLVFALLLLLAHFL